MAGGIIADACDHGRRCYAARFTQTRASAVGCGPEAGTLRRTCLTVRQLAQLEPSEARDGDVFSGFRRRIRDHLLDADVGVANRRLFEQADLREVALELAFSDLVDDVRRLA